MIPTFPPQQPQVIRPERRETGRFARCSRFALPSRVLAGFGPKISAICFWRARTAFQSASSTIRRCGTSVLIHADSGFGRETRLPVLGSLTKRSRFQTRTPAYSSLLTMPVPRLRWPRMLVSPHARPSGPGVPSLFRSTAMALGLLPEANSRKMRRTISASSGMISRSPRIGSPFPSSFFTTL